MSVPEKFGAAQLGAFNSFERFMFPEHNSSLAPFIYGTIINYIPGINATGVLHDTWWNPVNGNPGTMFGLGFNAATNWGTMLPAAAITYGALQDNNYAGQTVILDRLRK